MDEATAASPAPSKAVLSISLADLQFNLEKKNTSKSKRAVGVDELRRVITEMEAQLSVSPPAQTEPRPQLASLRTVLEQTQQSQEVTTENHRRGVSAERQLEDPTQQTEEVKQSVWMEGFLDDDNADLFPEEEVKMTQKVPEIIEVKGERVATPEPENDSVSVVGLPLHPDRIADDTNPPTPHQPTVLPPTSADKSPEPEHHPDSPFRIESLKNEGEVEPCPTAFPPKPKKPKRQKPIPTLETIESTYIQPLPKAPKPQKPVKVDVGLQPVLAGPTLDIGGKTGFEIKRVESHKEEEKVKVELTRPLSPATESKESREGVPRQTSVSEGVRGKATLLPLGSATLSSIDPSLTTKATGSPRSEHGAEVKIAPLKRPGTSTSSIPPESPFDLPVRRKPSHRVSTSIEILEFVSLPGYAKTPPPIRTSLETLHSLSVPAQAKSMLSLHNTLTEMVSPEVLETSEIGVATQIHTSADQMTETEVKMGLTSWTMSLYPPEHPKRALAVQSTLSNFIQPIHPPTPVRNRRRRKLNPNRILYHEAVGDCGALFQLTPAVGHMMKVKEYVVLNDSPKEKLSLPPLYSPDVAHAMSLQRRYSNKGFPRERVAASPIRPSESYRSREYYMRFRGIGSVGHRVVSRDIFSESPEKAFRGKSPKSGYKLL